LATEVVFGQQQQAHIDQCGDELLVAALDGYIEQPCEPPEDGKEAEDSSHQPEVHVLIVAVELGFEELGLIVAFEAFLQGRPCISST